MRRTRYLVCYDICDDRRLKRVAKALEGFGSRIQYSVFECPLTKTLLAKLKLKLSKELKPSEDQVLFISLGSEDKDADLLIESMGLPYTKRSIVNIV